jgi:hypothetical protein
VSKNHTFSRESKSSAVSDRIPVTSPESPRDRRSALRFASRLTGVVLLLLFASPAFAIVPSLPPIIVVPAVPAEKPDGEEMDDVTKLADRISKNAKGISDKLGEQDTGEATRKDQKKLKQDIDKLIDLLQNQPPPPMSSDSNSPPPPSGGGGGGGGSSKPMGGQQKPMGGSRRTGSGKRQPMPMGGQPMPMGNKGEGQPMPMGGKPDDKGDPMGGQPMGNKEGNKEGNKGGNEPGMGGKATPSLPLAETMSKDLWGHLPELPRQRMMQFFREQYNSRYKDLLPDYFTTLSEKEKKGKK